MAGFAWYEWLKCSMPVFIFAFLNVLYHRSGGSVVERVPIERKVVGSIPELVMQKTLLKKVPDTSLLSVQHINLGQDFSSLEPCSKLRWFPSGLAGRE